MKRHRNQPHSLPILMPTSVPACPYRQLTHDPKRFYCLHRRVHAVGHFVTPEICRSCTARHIACPNPRSAPAPEKRLPDGLRTRDPKAMSRARLLPGKPTSLPPTSSVTIGVTAFERPASLHRLLASLARHYADVRTVVVDTGNEPLREFPGAVRYERRTDRLGNLSAARNALVHMAKTEFIWILEDDFELTDADSLTVLLDVLASDPEVGVVGGRLIEDDELRDFACDVRQFRDTLEVTQPPSSRWLATARGTLYRYCDMVFNFFLARREVLLEHPWDEDLPLHEHAAWFLKLAQHAKWAVAFTPATSAIHHRDRPSSEYRRARARSNAMRSVLEAKYGFASVRHMALERAQRSNVLVLGVGHDNTSITTRQLFKLGWQAGDADEEFAESVSVREVNQLLIRTGEFPVHDAYHALAQLPQPWALKDPRFARTLDRWLPLLVDYEPLLLWLHKDLETVLESYRRRGELVGREDVVRRRYENCQRLYEMWPWAKLSISAEQIAEAVAIFDLRRTQGGGGDAVVGSEGKPAG